MWPLWFIREFHGQGPFTISRGGVLYTRRDEVTAVSSNALFGVHVPACNGCNTVLAKTIEEPAQPVVQRILAHRDSPGELHLSVDECGALARWLMKVGLLSAHPAADHDHRGLQQDQDRPTLPTVRAEWLDWMRIGSSPPSGFSVFITRRTLKKEDSEPAVRQSIVLPQVIVDGEDLNFMSRSFGLSGVNVTIVWHPGWPIIHAQVDANRAARLWPNPDEFDFGALPPVHPQELTFWDGPIGSLVISASRFATLAEHPLSVEYDHIAALFGNAAAPRE